MKRIRLIAAMPDEAYLKALSGYMGASDLSSRWSLECFSTMEALQQRLGTGEVDAAIIHPSWLEEAVEASASFPARLLCAWSDAPSVEQIGGFPAVFKYQSVILMLQHIKSLLREQQRMAGDVAAAAGGKEQARTIAVYSAVGGAGKTTLSVQLLELLARQLRPVLYIGLESTASLAAFIPGDGGWEGGDFSRLLYELEHGGEPFADKLRQAIRRDALRGFYYLPPVTLAEDAEAMTAETTRRLVEQARSLGLFECIVLDLESSLHARNRGAFEAADEIWWLLMDDSISLLKTIRRAEEWERTCGERWKAVSMRIRHIVNRSMDREVSPECRRKLPTVAGVLPEVPEWRSGSHAAPLAAGMAYADSLRRLVLSVGGKGEDADG